ncbi:MAG: NosD domain-containing protein [Pirellulales bacterium]
MTTLAFEPLERREMLAVDISPAPFLQWFEASYDTINERMPDLFAAGYGAVYAPPPFRGDTSDFTVGYDVYDRFDLGQWDKKTLYGTEDSLKRTAEVLHRAGRDLHVDFVLNHNGYSDFSTPGFVDAGGYPGLSITLPDDIDGDFHSAFWGGPEYERLAGLVDIAHEKNHRFIRNPVDDDDPRNIRAGTAPAFGRIANVPDSENGRFYPDIGHDTIFIFDPATGEQNIPVHSFNLENPMAGDAVEENALGYLMRNAQWLIQTIGVDGLRIDAGKHMQGFVFDFFDRAVYRANRRPLLDGSPQHVFSYTEVFDANPAVLLPHVKKDIDPNDAGRVGGNRDTLDFKWYFAVKDNLEHYGQPNAWGNVKDAGLDVSQNGLHDGSAGLKFVQNHDVFKPFKLNNVAHALMLMLPGNAVVYFNGKEFGEDREFPKEGRGDALSVGAGSLITRLVEIRKTHGRGNYAERWVDDQGIYIFERVSNAVVGLSNRGDGGFDERTVEVGFAPGTLLVELTGNADDLLVDPFNDISEVLTVFEGGDGKSYVTIRVPRNLNANGLEHQRGYVIYGLGKPHADAGLELIGVDSVLAGDTDIANDSENGKKRQSDLHVVKGDTIQVRLRTREVRHLGLDELRDIFADGDNAMLKLDSGRDVNGNGFVDHVTPGSPTYGYEFFTGKSSPLIGLGGLGAPRGDGEFLQTIDLTQLEEGVHFVEARAFRHRTDGGPAAFAAWNESIYVDRLPPVVDVKEIRSVNAVGSGDHDILLESPDYTADNVHVFLNLPGSVTEQESRDLATQGQGAAEQVDLNLYKTFFGGMKSGNNVLTVVTFEPTGTANVQRLAGQQLVGQGAGLGDLNFDGQYTTGDIAAFDSLLAANNTQFNPAGDLDGDGRILSTDLILLEERLSDVNADAATLQAYHDLVASTLELDYGDAADDDPGPPNFPTLLADDGARHDLVSALFLGADVDQDADGQPDGTATGDDLDGNNDDDGVTLNGTLLAGGTASFTISASAAGFIDAWIDFDGDGTWTPAGDEYFLKSLPVVAGNNEFQISVPSNSLFGDTFARFRLSSAGGLLPTGLALDGEVEDYRFAVSRVNRFTVNSVGDGSDLHAGDGICADVDGMCNLRAAIEESNASANLAAGPDIIRFNIPGAGPHVIQPSAALPNITETMTIDGTSQPGFDSATSRPVIEIDGTNAGVEVSGFRVSGNGGGSTIRGLAINRFSEHGVFVSRRDGVTIEHNFIGTDPTGTMDRGNAEAGIYIINAESNVVRQNTISGNDRFGVKIEGPQSTGNLVTGNMIGINAAGASELKNRIANVEIAGAPGNTIGGSSADDRNVISGSKSGVAIRGGRATDNVVIGNRIGTNADGTVAIRNTRGVNIVDGAGNTIGGPGGAANLISGNTKGIEINRGQGNLVHGNYVGTDVTGTVGLANTRGVQIRNAVQNQIGNEPNLISGNVREGVKIFGALSTGNVVVGNFIGTNAAGNAAVSNREGVVISGNATGNTIGGTTVAARNVISGNTVAGVFLKADGNVVVGNFIGTSAGGDEAVGNKTGVYIRNGEKNMIGGSLSGGEGNLISGNDEQGVFIIGSLANDNTVSGNAIGTNVAGTAAVANKNGVRIETGGHTIGGDTTDFGNAISGNSQNGIYLKGPSAAGNLVQNNRIGTNTDGTGPLANARSGVLIENAVGNTIGAAGGGNTIGGNAQQGVKITGVAATGNQVQNNSIGLDGRTLKQIGNRDGIRISDGAYNNLVGGEAGSTGNEIAYNTSRGVWISGGTGNRVSQNAIHDNGGLGIAIGGQNAAPNDADDDDDGANNLQNTPDLTSAMLSMGNLGIQYEMSSSATNSAYPITVEFFLADTGGEQAEAFLGQDSIVGPGAKTANIDAGPAAINRSIVATATDADGNTSELSASVTVAAPLLATESSRLVPQVDLAYPVSWQQLEPLIVEGVSRLVVAGFAADLLSDVEFVIADLPGATLGLTVGNLITIDFNAAGYGWYIDTTPRDDKEFSASQPALRIPLFVDLLTVVMHELGHVTGLEDLHDEKEEDEKGKEELMYATLQPGIRKAGAVVAASNRAIAE